MHMMSKTQIRPSLASMLVPAAETLTRLDSFDYTVIDAAWQPTVPALRGDSTTGTDLTETLLALQQAEEVLRAQEERIRVLESLAMTDELTGLVNRRGFSAAFERELTLARRDTQAGGVLVMVDLDGFKKINDCLGHQAGDAYLQEAALALAEGTRRSDIVARFGGDEFVVLLTRLDAQDAAKRLARLERFFHQRALVWHDQRIPLRASFGSAAYNGMQQAETCLHDADRQLYARKALCKKRVAAL